MPTYRNRTSGEEMEESAVRRTFNGALPAVLDATLCDMLNVDPVLIAPPPPISEDEFVSRDGLVRNSLGNWVYAWKVKKKSAAQVAIETLEQAGIARDAAKLQRQENVDRIKVTTSTGRIFDGDEVSQGRMARAILALEAEKQESTPWVLADNTPVIATASELREALVLAGKAQTAVWII